MDLETFYLHTFHLYNNKCGEKYFYIYKVVKPLCIYIQSMYNVYKYPEIIGEANLFFVKEYIECRVNESSSFYIYL